MTVIGIAAVDIQSQAAFQMSKAPAKPLTEEALRTYIDALVEQNRLLKQQNEILEKRAAAEESSVFSPTMPLWIIVRDYLRQNEGAAPVQEIVDALLDRGHNMGKYPLRNLKIMVTGPHMRPIFKVQKTERGEVILLVEKQTTYAPRSARSGASKGARSTR